MSDHAPFCEINAAHINAAWHIVVSDGDGGSREFTIHFVTAENVFIF